MFPELADDPAQRAAFRDRLHFVAKARRQVPQTPEEVAELNMLAQARFTIEIEGQDVGVHEPMPERTVDDVLSESAVELRAADAAEALAAAFEDPA